MYDLKATDAQLANVEEALRANELRRKEIIDANKQAKDASKKAAEKQANA